ncbi:MAG: Tim44/TimA family putative adaptor protein [Magnetococcales bacterium]|nr:Tim44/TimA family putative adaptor protein [Magnetococcales bacterium]
MKSRHPVLLILLFLLGLTIALPPIEAEAGRAGGGSSMGSRGSRSFSTPREAPAQRSDFSQPTTPSSAMASPSAPRSGFGAGLMGGLTGLMIGGLIGSMLFGGEGSGMGLLEMLLLGGVAWFLFQRFGKGRASAPAPASMPEPHPAQGPVSLRKVSLEKEMNFSGNSPFQGQELPRTFAMGQGVDEVSQGLAQIASQDPQFNEARFLDGAKAAYQQIQSAWSDWSVDRLRPLLTERMWSMIEQQAKERQAAGRRDILEKIRFQTAELSEAWQEAGENWITVHFVVEMLEYETDLAGRVLNGDPNRPILAEEYWTFCRPVGSRNPNWFLSAIQQPGEVARSVP